MKNRPLTTKYLAQRDFRQMVIALGPLLAIDCVIVYIILNTDYISVSDDLSIQTILSLVAVAIVSVTVTPAMAGVGLLFCLLADAIVAIRAKNGEQKAAERSNA
jgi:hypothetical protein